MKILGGGERNSLGDIPGLSPLPLYETLPRDKGGSLSHLGCGAVSALEIRVVPFHTLAVEQ